MADAQLETSSVSPRMRTDVLDRDGHCCRVCGAYAENPAVHHVEYTSEGGLAVMSNLITTHWMYRPRCHELVHGRKWLWQPILKVVAVTDGVNAMQLLRWYKHQREGMAVAAASDHDVGRGSFSAR